MTSRLERLFLLLDNGGSAATRKAAALQLGEVVRLHPHELDTLLERLHIFITSKSWETRIAAGQAVEAVLANLPNWDPKPAKAEQDNETAINSAKEMTGHLSLRSFSITNILQKGSSLLSEDSSQFEMDEETANLDPQERAVRLRGLVNQKLGLVGINSESIVSNEDLVFVPEHINSSATPKESVVQIVQSEMASAGITLSSRELNRAKRKAKILSKQKSSEPYDCPADSAVSERKRQKLMSQDTCRPNDDEYDDDDDEDECQLMITDNNRLACEQGMEWPLDDFTEQLCRYLFSSSWETRHGAATALREVIRLQGRGAGKTSGQTVQQMASTHERWLEDKAVRLVCVLALDRFGDFLTDQVVAPVRETCAQVLGGIVHLMTEGAVLDILSLLLEMLSWHDWGTRHGGLLGLKYLLAVKTDMRMKLLTQAYSHIFKGLQDEMDDVIAVAATCLVPVAEDLVGGLPSEEIHQLLEALWDALLDIDDLTASTNSILQLLAKLHSCPQVRQSIPGNLDTVIPRIWPFLYHSSCYVRLSALKTLETLTSVTAEVATAEDEDERQTNPEAAEAAKGKTREWMQNILEPLMVHTYQRSLLENCAPAICLIVKIWNNILSTVSLNSVLMVSCRYLPCWLALLMTSPKIPLDSNHMVLAYHHQAKADGAKKKRRSGELGESVSKVPTKLYLGGADGTQDDSQTAHDIAQSRRVAASLIGNLSHYVSQPMPGIEYQPNETPILCYVQLLLSHLNSRSGIQRLCGGLIAREWAIQHPQTLCHSLLKAALLNCALEIIYYDEITWSFTRLQQETRDFSAMLRHYRIYVDPSFTSLPILTLEQIKCICESVMSDIAKLRKKVSETLESRRMDILKSVSQTSGDQIKLSITIQAALAGALVRFRSLPERLNPIIKPLMESIKKERDEEQQKLAAADLTVLLDLCVDRQPCPNVKIVKNLASFLCVDELFTPSIYSNSASEQSVKEGIFSLLTEDVPSSMFLMQRGSSFGGRGPGRPPSKSVASSRSSTKPVSSTSSMDNRQIPMEILRDIESQQQNEVQRRGCVLALTSVMEYFGADLEEKLPHMVTLIFEPFANSCNSAFTMEAQQNIINWLQLLEVVIPPLHTSILSRFYSHLKDFDHLLSHSRCSVRHMAGRVLATLASVASSVVMTHIIENLVPVLSDVSSVSKRQGTIECIHLTIEKLGCRIVPFIVLLIVPLLGCMSDHEKCVRLLATRCFATLIRLFPLDGGNLECGDLSSRLLKQRKRERIFLDRLIDPKKIDDYKVPVPIKAELRSYQQKGVNWLAFLNQYNLHGILCDDMGLGKTLQSICILAGDHYTKEKQIKEGKLKSPEQFPCKTGVQSLVVCPPTLTGHWYYEIGRFVAKQYLNPLHYTGPPFERKRLRNFISDHNLVIASYKIVRNEVDFFKQIKWNYIVLDEGHIIKNGKTKSSKAIKELTGNHRLILTGTPIQNNVLELWSLFDFLMPGFLGTERQFMAKYSRPILQSRDPKSSMGDQEAGALAMEALHRQVLPFLLRRVKEDVLKDLPPKITQDYYCELSPLQEKLYEDFARTKTCQNMDDAFNAEGNEKPKAHDHIFQALQYLRRVCNHPKLVIVPTHPQYDSICRQIRERKLPLTDISHSAKLPALKQLLLDCGIGCTDDDAGISSSAVVSPHRALIFCQLKGMLDIIENDLFKIHMPSVTFLRLDGSVPAGSRHSLVQRFNSDPSIDVLLLTTHVGGLGLNLTGADTVIFVEHDWNPMRDLQAMDRTHRIGQKRVVNVYRLITKGTLEEKIMSLQKFKLMTANSVISQENSSLQSMGTDQLLDLFTLDNKGSELNYKHLNQSSERSEALGLRGAGVREVIQSLPDLWKESVYEEEYNLDNFIASLK